MMTFTQRIEALATAFSTLSTAAAALVTDLASVLTAFQDLDTFLTTSS